ncbi:hypothetical protein [Moorena producens]|nr:hypothetical protein [Moorena producens]
MQRLHAGVSPKTALHRLSTIQNYKASNFVSSQPSAVSRQPSAFSSRY